MVDDNMQVFHKSSISRLVGRFGADKEADIRDVYNDVVSSLEASGAIPNFVPLIAYNRARDLLREKYPTV